MKLKDLIFKELCTSENILEGSEEIEVKGVTSDSRKIKEGFVFFAVLGASFDGKVFVKQAFEAGAVAVVYSGKLLNKPKGLAIQVSNVRRAISYAAANFFSNPSHSLKNIAITGTSGKTSTAWLISLALQKMNETLIMGGTLGYTVISPAEDTTSKMKELTNTTIEPVAVHRYLQKAKNENATFSVFEVTSQGIVQNRMRDVAWNAALFLNLSRDHLDLHGSMENYLAAKKDLFIRDLIESNKKDKFAVFNLDDEYVKSVVYEMKVNYPEISTVTVSKNPDSKAEYLIKNIEADTKGICFDLECSDCAMNISSPMVGIHNAYNISFAAITLKHLGFKPNAISQAISSIPVPPGRLEPITSEKCSVFIDYAHKPDALEKVLLFLKPLCKGRIISVMGCGGDRDKGKRPLMGKISSDLADISIITSDNPRTENPQSIIDEIVAGIEVNKRNNITVLPDRKEAIVHAIDIAEKGDVILIAGKGHEPYQEINGIKHDFNDLLIAKEALGIN